jgi:hypothetical protein
VTAVFETVLGLLVVTLAGMDPSPHRGWAPDRFRKIRPADEGFSVWMKQMRPRVQERTDA